MPSIQLAILRQCLAGIARVDTHELYMDYAATISENVYRTLSEAGGMVEEWLFAKPYFEREGVSMPEGFLDEFPPLGLADRDRERRLLVELLGATDDYLQRMAENVDWGQYDVVAFSLTIYQTASSMAMAQQIKRRHPHVRVIFGGNSCVGPAASAMLKACPYIDVVVKCEAELVFADLVERLASHRGITDLPSLVYRDADGRICESTARRVHDFDRVSDTLVSLRARPDAESYTSPGSPRRADGYLDYTPFFERFERLSLSGRENIWLPFESSRGCWWGEKSQCTFCGLHEIMRYRARSADSVLEELDSLHARYGVPRFFATDLIMPQEYYKTFLPRLIESDRDYEFFYELKGNVTRAMVRALSAAGVCWSQPGLESLSTAVLRLMKKGMSATQSVQFLKWAADYSVFVHWNVIVGMPGEDPIENERAAARVPSLHHLQPPRVVQFELDRYSPIFENPEEHGLADVEPLYLYHYIFPLPKDVLRALVYRFEYTSEDFGGAKPPWLGGEEGDAEYAASLQVAVEEWNRAHERGASLRMERRTDGSARLLDTRASEVPVHHELSPLQCRLYDYLDARRPLGRLGEGFRKADPVAHDRLGGNPGVLAQVRWWVEERLVFEEDGHVVSLALGAEPPSRRVGDHVPARWPQNLAEWSDRIRANGLEQEVVGTRSVSSTRRAAMLELSDSTRVFVKECDSASECALYDELTGPGMPPVLRELSPRRIFVDERGLAAYEGLVPHRSWYEMLLDGDGFEPAVAAAVGSALAVLHSVDPARVPAVLRRLELPPPVGTYEDVTIRSLAASPGQHYRVFLRTAQRVSPALRELREDWRSVGFIHGDSKADNIMIWRRPGDVSVRLVDWELARAGDPLYDVGTAVGSILLAWLEGVPALATGPLSNWFDAADIDPLIARRCATALMLAYESRRQGRLDEGARARFVRYAGVFLLERGLVASRLAGRMPLHARLAMEVGAAALATPLAVGELLLW